MKRVFVYLSALVGLGGAVYLAGNTRAQMPTGAPPAAPPAAAPTVRPTIAVFNMAAVMRDFQLAKVHVGKLNDRKNELSKDLIIWQAEFTKMREDYEKLLDPGQKEAKAKEMVAKRRQIEDKEREVNKVLQDEASQIIAKIHDHIKMAVDRTAVANGYHVVFAFGDAVSEEEKNLPYVKEMRLKPPAAFPFYYAGYVDVTKVVVDSLNAWFPAPPGSVVPGGPAPAVPSTGPAPTPMGTIPAGGTAVPPK